MHLISQRLIIMNEMNSWEEKPRKVPKPIPFCQNSTLHPTVPEVSLILQETNQAQSLLENNSFSGTEFQTYNAWRWKNVNDKEKNSFNCKFFVDSNPKKIYPINDRFCDSDIEKRKNEILYGNPDEPRRPLPPRSPAIIPQCLKGSFSDASFSNECIEISNGFQKSEVVNHNFCLGFDNNDKKCEKSKSHNITNDIGDLYQIITEQNKQMSLLQIQIQQLLKALEIKEKQIEQLLKTQEVKEYKIEQLLNIQDLKESHIEQLLKAQEKNEKQIEQLIQSQNQREKQSFEILKQINEKKKSIATVSVMTEVDTVEKGTNTNMVCHCQSDIMKGLQEKTSRDQNAANYIGHDSKDKSFTLNSLDLPLPQESIPTPQSSIHVDIPEYNGSSDEESNNSTSLSKEIQVINSNSKSLGHTFYNNVLTQVNDIIHSNEDKENEILKCQKNCERTELDMENLYNKKFSGLREHNLQIHHTNFWSTDFNEGNDKIDFIKNSKKSRNYAESKTNAMLRQKIECNNAMDIQSPSDISLRMNALAMKYLKQEQISQYEIQPQLQQTCRQSDVTIYNVTNLSIGTMRYLERYHISSGENTHISNNQPLKEDIYPSDQFPKQKADSRSKTTKNF